jgi:primosomal protein N'
VPSDEIKEAIGKLTYSLETWLKKLSLLIIKQGASIERMDRTLVSILKVLESKSICQYCFNARQIQTRCPNCDGARKVLEESNLIPCRTCNERGWTYTKCPYCSSMN